MKKILSKFFMLTMIGMLLYTQVFAYQAIVDSTFIVGTWFNGSVNAVAVQSDGKVVIAGYFSTYQWQSANHIIRLNTDGSRDTGFDIWVWFVGFIAQALAIQSDGKIIVGWSFSSYKWVSANNIIRLNTDGSRDTGFNIWWWFNSQLRSLAIQSDGKIIAWGEFTTYSWTSINHIARLNTDGTRDTSFSVSALTSLTPIRVRALAVQSDGKIIAAGQITKGITRLNTDGIIDTGFNAGGAWFPGGQEPWSLAIQGDGKIIVGWASLASYNWWSVNRILRLNTNGSNDITFAVGVWFGAGYVVYALAIQGDGKIIAWGSFTTYKWAWANNIVRLNSDASMDTGFATVYWFDASVQAVAVQTDWKVFAGGWFSSFNSTSVPYFAALFGEILYVTLSSPSSPALLQNQFTTNWYTFSNGEFLWSNAISLASSNGYIALWFTVKNANIKFTLPTDIQINKADNTTPYSGILAVPTATSVPSINGTTVLTSFKVGSPSEPLKLAWWMGNLVVPIAGASVWDPIEVKYSDDNKYSWNSQIITTASDIWGGIVWVSFDINHMTDFAIIWYATGTFVINNDDPTTSSSGVTLNISGAWLTNMRFWNTIGERNAASWETFSTTKAWTLSAGTGTKTVYAQFNSGAISTSDDIQYIDAATGCIWSSCADITLQIIANESWYCEIGDSVN
ncbi:MAG: hypothetical protein ACD_80C00099G0001, partial [uncultured bacterium (gcode 4)]